MFLRSLARGRASTVTLAAAWILSLCVLTHAQAQSAADKAAAEALFDRGLALMKEGKYQEACERLEQSQAVERGIGTMLYLAECYEKIGKTASAWALFREAASSAQAAGQSERADAGRKRAERLEKGLSRLTIHVPPANRAPGLVVQDNGSQLQQAVWGVALPVDPGVHKVEVSAPGYVAWSGEVRVDDRAGSAEVHVPALAKDPNAVAVSTPVSGDAKSPEVGTSEPVTRQPLNEEPGMSKLRITGIVLGAAGVVGLALGATFGGLAMKNDKTVDRERDGAKVCPNDTCNDALADGKVNANLSTAFFAVGGALFIGGLVTYLIAPKHDIRKTRVALSIDPRGAALGVGGVF